MFSGNHGGRKITSGGSAGRSSQDHSPNSASQKPGEHARALEPAVRAHELGGAAHVRGVDGTSPASRSAT